MGVVLRIIRHPVSCAGVKSASALVWLTLALFSRLSMAACSPYAGTVVFNEVQIPNGGTAYVELRVLDPNVVAATSQFATWKIAVYEATSGNLVSTASLNSIFANTSLNSWEPNSPWINKHLFYLLKLRLSGVYKTRGDSTDEKTISGDAGA